MDILHRIFNWYFLLQVGWSHEKLVHALKENQKEVTLTLKKRPRHSNPLGSHGHRNKKKTKNVQQSTFPRLSRMSRDSEKGARAPLKDFLSAFPSSPAEPMSERSVWVSFLFSRVTTRQRSFQSCLSVILFTGKVILFTGKVHT